MLTLHLRYISLALAMFISTTCYAQTVTGLPACEGVEPYLPERTDRWSAQDTGTIDFSGYLEISKDQIKFANGVTAKLQYIGNRQFKLHDRTVCAGVYKFDPPFSSESICAAYKQEGPKTIEFMVAYNYYGPRYPELPVRPSLRLSFIENDSTDSWCGLLAYSRS